MLTFIAVICPPGTAVWPRIAWLRLRRRSDHGQATPLMSIAISVSGPTTAHIHSGPMYRGRRHVWRTGCSRRRAGDPDCRTEPLAPCASGPAPSVDARAGEPVALIRPVAAASRSTSVNRTKVSTTGTRSP